MGRTGTSYKSTIIDWVESKENGITATGTVVVEYQVEVGIKDAEAVDIREFSKIEFVTTPDGPIFDPMWIREFQQRLHRWALGEHVWYKTTSSSRVPTGIPGMAYGLRTKLYFDNVKIQYVSVSVAKQQTSARIERALVAHVRVAPREVASVSSTTGYLEGNTVATSLDVSVWGATGPNVIMEAWSRTGSSYFPSVLRQQVHTSVSAIDGRCSVLCVRYPDGTKSTATTGSAYYEREYVYPSGTTGGVYSLTMHALYVVDEAIARNYMHASGTVLLSLKPAVSKHPKDEERVQTDAGARSGPHIVPTDKVTQLVFDILNSFDQGSMFYRDALAVVKCTDVCDGPPLNLFIDIDLDDLRFAH